MADQSLVSGVSYCRQAMSMHPRILAPRFHVTGATAACSARTVPRPHAVCALQVVKLWREDLASINAKAAESLADPAQYPNLFPNLDLALHAEQYQVRSSTLTCPRPSCFVQCGCPWIWSSGVCASTCALCPLCTPLEWPGSSSAVVSVSHVGVSTKCPKMGLKASDWLACLMKMHARAGSEAEQAAAGGFLPAARV